MKYVKKRNSTSLALSKPKSYLDRLCTGRPGVLLKANFATLGGALAILLAAGTLPVAIPFAPVLIGAGTAFGVFTVDVIAERFNSKIAAKLECKINKLEEYSLELEVRINRLERALISILSIALSWGVTFVL